MEKITNIETPLLNSCSRFIEAGLQSVEGLVDSNIVGIDLQFSDNEKIILNQLEIKNNTDVQLYDLGDGKLLENLKAHLAPIGENNQELISGLAEIIASRALSFRKIMGKEALSVTVRITLPHHYNDVPRWHDDGSYFTQNEQEKVYKMVFPVIGPSTLFGEILDRERYNELLAESYKNDQVNSNDSIKLEAEDLRIRKELDTVINTTTVVSDGQAALFLVGNKDAVIHSEPKISTPRIFVAVLTGTKEQIREMSSQF